jgi:hemolysin III
MSLDKIELHKYTLAEELINSISHGVGALLSIGALVIGIIFSVLYGNTLRVVSVTIYGASLVFLYTNSTIYHALRPNAGKKVFRVIDHCAIYILIAGTYTPYTLVTLRGTLGLVLLVSIWAAAALGIALTVIDLKKYAKFSMVCYLVMGWDIVFAVRPLLANMAPGGLFLLLLGGLFYTAGAVLYLIGRRKKYIHSVWHFFVLAGSVAHYFSILFYVILT